MGGWESSHVLEKKVSEGVKQFEAGYRDEIYCIIGVKGVIVLWSKGEVKINFRTSGLNDEWRKEIDSEDRGETQVSSEALR